MTGPGDVLVVTIKERIQPVPNTRDQEITKPPTTHRTTGNFLVYSVSGGMVEKLCHQLNLNLIYLGTSITLHFKSYSRKKQSNILV